MSEKDSTSKEPSPAERCRADALKLYKERVAPQINSVYYPFCGSDIAPWIAFPEADITGIDKDNLKINHLRERGVGKLVISNVLNFHPTQTADTLLVLGWRAANEECAHIKDWVKTRGHIVTDSNWVAGTMLGHFKSTMDLVGRINYDLEVETIDHPLTRERGLGHLRHLAKEPQSTRTNTLIALQAAITNPEL